MRGLLCIQSFILRIIQTKLSALRILLQSNFSGIIKSSEQAKPLLILGNGPSLNETLQTGLAHLGHYDLLAVNNAANHEQYAQLQPKYYLLNAVTYFQADSELNEFYIQTNKDIYKSMQLKTHWKLLLLVPFRAKKSVAFNHLLSANANIEPLYFNQTPVEGLSFWSHLWYDWGWGMPRPHNVLIPGIMVGIQLGYKNIALVGADHSWLTDLSVNDKNEALLRHVHYYDTEGTQPMKVEDRIAKPRKLHEIIHKFYLSFRGYWQIESYAKKRGVRIVNASKVSMIDAFERSELKDLNNQKP